LVVVEESSMKFDGAALQHSRVPPPGVIFASVHFKWLRLHFSASVHLARVAEQVELAAENLKGKGVQDMGSLTIEEARNRKRGGLGKIARLLEEGTIRPDVATVYALQDAAQAWKDIAGNLPGVHGMSPSGPGAARRRSHGKIVLRVA
jgi:Zinc-binding dehydrogenase